MTTTPDATFAATRALVGFSRDLRLHSVPDGVVEHAALLVLDLLGVALSATADGHLENLNDLAALVAQDGGTATVLGCGRIARPQDAALLNGYLAHLMEWDDSTLKPIGHPSITILPAVLALAEAQHSSGGAVLQAYLVGLEIHSRLGQAQARPWSSHDSWLPIGHIGLVGAAVACAHLLGLDGEQTAHTIGLAAHFCGGLAVSGGTEAKPLGAGHAASCAVSAALLARAGVTARTDVIEADGGFADTFFGRGGHDLHAALASLGDGPLHMEEVGIAIKRYPTVYGTHWAADALRLIMREHALTAIDVASVDLVYPSASAFVDNPSPRTPDEARFSQQYLLACCLAHGTPLPRHFTIDAMGSAPVRAALALITARPHPPESIPPACWAYDVTVSTTDGRRLQRAVPRPHGHPRDPLTANEIRAKFLDATADVLDDRRARRIIDLVRDLPGLPDITTLMDEVGASVDRLVQTSEPARRCER